MSFFIAVWTFVWGLVAWRQARRAPRGPWRELNWTFVSFAVIGLVAGLGADALPLSERGALFLAAISGVMLFGVSLFYPLIFGCCVTYMWRRRRKEDV